MISSPAAVSAATATSRRRRYASRISATQSCGPVSAASAATWDTAVGHATIASCVLATSAASSGLAAR